MSDVPSKDRSAGGGAAASSTSMGDMFKQRRTDRQQQQQMSASASTAKSTTTNKKSLLEIQAEQEREQQHRGDGMIGTGGRISGKGGREGGRGGGGNGTGYSNNSRRNDRNTGSNDSNNYGSRNSSSSNHNHGRSGNSSIHSSYNGSDGGDDRISDERRGGAIGGRQQQRGRGGGRGNMRSNNADGSNVDAGRLANLPIEQGLVCSLRDGFGFIHCADRPEQIFFHFSELREGLRSTDIRIDDELQFRVGESPDTNKRGGGGSTNEATKRIAALHVTRLPAGTSIVWEYPDETFKYPVKGIVERAPRLNDISRGGNAPVEGTIRILPDDIDIMDYTSSDSGQVVRFLPDEYSPSNKCEYKGNDSLSNINSSSFSDINNSSTSSPGTSRLPSTLSRGDIVEISRIVTDRRSKERYAKGISMILSERQRNFHAQESKLLASGTVEHGVVTTVKGEYGFLKSNKRHEEIYFHMSNVSLTDDDSKIPPAEGSSNALKEGQEMKFLVVTEGGDNTDDGGGGGRSRRRISARQIQVQPVGSVAWHDVLAQGVTGVVTECPQPIDSGHPLETQGKVRLNIPIKMKKKHSLEEALDREEKHKHGITTNDSSSDSDDYITCTEVYIWSKDSPGGNFAYRGGTSVGLYIQNGDTVLFDVIRDFIGDGGTCRAAPSKYLTPRVDAQEESHLEAETDPQYTDSSKAIRLIDLALPGRSEGVISALKDNAYGFLHFAERPVDVHFKMYQILPDALQADLRRNMGLRESVRLDVGVEVQFDLSVHGTISPASKQVGGNSNKKRQQQPHERENLKAQRVLFLPPGTIHQSVTVAKCAKGKVIKQDPMQPYSGTVELDEPVTSLSPEARHPLVSRMISAFLANPLDNKIVFHDIQSMKEDEVVIKMTKTLGNGQLKCSHIPVSGESQYPGLLCIEKIKGDVDGLVDSTSQAHDNKQDRDETREDRMNQDECLSNDGISHDGEEDDGVEAESSNKSPKKKNSILKAKRVSTIRYDRHSLSPEFLDESPLGVGDVITFDIAHTRRTGQLVVTNMKVVQRHVPEITNTGIEAFGVVKDVMPNRNLGFLSFVDALSNATEMLSFQLDAVVMPRYTSNKSRNGDNKLRKGDTVKFTIGKDTQTGKHYLLNAVFDDSKANASLAGNSKLVDTNPCRGIVLLRLTKNSYLAKKDATAAKKKKINELSATSQVQQNVPEKKSRWENVITSKDDDSRQEGLEVGCVLLTEDANSLFDQKVSKAPPATDVSIPDATASDPSIPESASTAKNEIAAPPVEPPTASAVGNERGEAGEADGVNLHLRFKRSSIAFSGNDESSYPQRGDLVSFNKTRTANGIRDLRIVARGAATLIRGTLESIQTDSGRAKFVTSSEPGNRTSYDVDFKEVVSCEVSTLKEKEPVEGILHDNRVFGICRVSDLYVESTIKSNISSSKSSSTERPKLNLTVKKDRGGTIMAQSMMAKGPDGQTKGFPPGWTSRLSAFATEFTLPGIGDGKS